MAVAERWASEILECSPLLLQLTKEAVKDGLGVSVEDAMARDWVERIPRLLTSSDYVEGPRAFAEKRKPVWTGT
jgi:enoyl-CoA hydratase/carnithine racemase